METLMIAELTAKDMGTRDIARKNSTLGEQVISIALNKVLVRDGFNVRQDYGDIESLASSIVSNGQQLPGKVDVLADGTFLLTDGHRRFKALQYLYEMFGEAPLFKAIVNSTKTTEEQRILQMFTTQDNKPLLPNEIAELLSRLINFGYKQADIAKKIGKTPAYVSQMLSYANESVVIKEHVSNGHINVSTVLKLQKEIPVQSERIAAVKKAVEIKKETNKTTSVSVADVTGKEKQQISNPVQLANAIATLYNLGDTDLKPMINLIKSYL